MKTLVLTRHDLLTVVQGVGIHAMMEQLTERLTVALQAFDANRTEIPLRTGFHYQTPTAGLLEWMPLMQRGEGVLMKMVGYHPGNGGAHDVPTIVSTLNLFDPSTGHLVAVMDGTLLTAMRTGAASAIATRILGAPDSRTVGIVGCGAQAVTQLHALSRVIDVREVVIHDIDPAATASFSPRVRDLVDASTLIDIAPMREVIRRADVLCVATSVEAGAGPVIEEAETKPWLHVNAVGSDFPGKIELPIGLLSASLVIPDCLDQARLEGECQQLSPGQIGPSLAEVVKRPEDFEAHRTDRTVFDSTGWALEDHVAMQLALEHAVARGLGTAVEIESLEGDPRHPYDGLVHNVRAHAADASPGA